jgi:hypothetical protein
LPGNEKIPIQANGTLLINPMAAKAARRIALNQLLLAAQQRGQGGMTTAHLEDIRDHIVLVRTPANPLAPPDVFATTIATLQSKTYLRRVSRVFDLCILVLAIIAGAFIERISRAYVVLGAIAFTAAYCLVALNLISQWLIWLPGFFPVGVIWLLVLFRLLQGRQTARIASAQ